MAGRVVCCLSCLGMVSELFEGPLDEFSTKPDVAVHQLIATLPLSDPRLAEICTKTATDQNLQSEKGLPYHYNGALEPLKRTCLPG